MNTADRLNEFVSLRLPAGAGRLLTDNARRMGLSRSELLRQAALEYIRRAAHYVPMAQQECELCQSCLGRGLTSTTDGAITCPRCNGGGYEPIAPAVDDEAES